MLPELLKTKAAAGAGRNRVAVRAVERQLAEGLAAVERDGAIGGERAPEVDFGTGGVRHAADPIQRLVPAQRDRRAVDIDRRVGEPLRLLAGQNQPRSVVVLVLDLLGLRDAHAVAAPVVSEEAGEADVVDGVLANLDDCVPIGGRGEAGSAPSGSQLLVSRDGIVVGEMLADEQARFGHTSGEIRILGILVLALCPGQSRGVGAAAVPNFGATLIGLDCDIRLGRQRLPGQGIGCPHGFVWRIGDYLVAVDVVQEGNRVDHPRSMFA